MASPSLHCAVKHEYGPSYIYRRKILRVKDFIVNINVKSQIIKSVNGCHNNRQKLVKKQI